MSEPSRHQLLAPKAEAEAKITAQIKQGCEIREFLAQPAFDLPLPAVFKQAEERQRKWAKYTIDLLKTLITDPDYLIHVEFGSVLFQYPPNRDRIEAFVELMNERIQCLESIVERLALFPVAVAIGATSAPSQQQSSGRMKLFISWSGDLSHRIALNLRDCIPVILPFVEPWVSSKDIPKGKRWSPEVANELENTHSGIICLVPDNLKEPWVHFEAGALSKTVKAARIHPFLVGVDPGELPGPLAQFQATLFSKDEMRQLFRDLNSEGAEAALPAVTIDRAFEVCWSDLERRIRPLFIESCKDLM